MNDEKRKSETDGQINTASVMNQASTSNAYRAEPGRTITASALRVAISNAERAVDDIVSTIQRLEIERDEHVRQAGRAQETLDRMQTERAFRTRHVRNLLGAQE